MNYGNTNETEDVTIAVTVVIAIVCRVARKKKKIFRASTGLKPVAFVFTLQTVFQITFKGRVSTRNFHGSIDVGLPHLLKFPIYFVGSGGQLSQVFELRSLCYLEHCAVFYKLSYEDPSMDSRPIYLLFSF